MGIKELWTILEPFSERRPLYELEGKTIAIDLSGWICDSQNIVEYNVQPNMFIRNLFFRTCCLLMIGAVPVFVLEGEAPSLKSNVMSKRNEIQFRGAKPRKPESNKVSQNTTRSRFKAVQKQCEKLLNALGLKCVRGPGEAEAYCAFLNELEYVDGIISQDSDCFGYGAKQVYRNFCISQQNTQGGSVDIYNLKKIQEVKNIGRNHIICLALLCGCDYCPEGVGGVGRDAALKLIEVYNDATILQRLRLWRNHNEISFLEAKVGNKNICTQCGHMGHIRKHTKSGCSDCSTYIGCKTTDYKEKINLVKNELTIRKKALVNPNFPDENIISEFITKPTDKPNLDLSWKMPSLHDFINIMSAVLEWEEIYSFQKFLPLLTRWHLKTDKLHCSLRPKVIHKRRKLKGVPSFEIIWEDREGRYDHIVPEDQIQNYRDMNNGLSLWVTVEPEHLVRRKYPEFVNNYEEAELLKKQKKKPVRNNTGRPRKAEKRTLVNKVAPKSPSIKEFFKVQKKVFKSTPVSQEKNNLSGLFSKIECEDDDELNLSDVIEDIISRPGIFNKPIVLESKVRDTELNVSDDFNTSNFFFNKNILHDEFEETFDSLTKISSGI